VKIKASNEDESLDLYEKLSSTILKALGEIEDLEKKGKELTIFYC
jgi:hypothetical protein